MAKYESFKDLFDELSEEDYEENNEENQDSDEITEIQKQRKLKKKTFERPGNMSEEEWFDWVKQVEREGGMYGQIVCMAVWGIMCIAEWLTVDSMDCGKPALVFIMLAFVDFYEGIMLGNKKTVLGGIVLLIIAVWCSAMYIAQLLHII